MCPAAKGYQDYVLSWVLDRYIKRYGVDTWYFDSMPVTMFAASRICFSSEHGPRQPRRWRFSFDGKNLTNKYDPVAGYDFGNPPPAPANSFIGGISQIGFYGPPRTWSFTVQYHF